MAWTAPQTWVASDPLPAAELNVDIRDNTLYLKGETDKLDDVTHVNQTASRVIDTKYTNSTKLRLVAVTVTCAPAAGNGATATAKIHASANPPTTIIGAVGAGASPELQPVQLCLTFLVPPSWNYGLYQTIAGGSSVTINYWSEWDLH